MLKHNKKYVKLILLIGIILIVPLLIDWLVIHNRIPSNISNPDWVSFLGNYAASIISGLITLFVLYRTLGDNRANLEKSLAASKKEIDDTIRANKELQEKQELLNEKAQIYSLYLFLNSKKKNVIHFYEDFTEKQKENGNDYINVTFMNFCSPEDQTFFYNRLPYCIEILGEKGTEKLEVFFEQLFVLQTSLDAATQNKFQKPDGHSIKKSIKDDLIESLKTANDRVLEAEEVLTSIKNKLEKDYKLV